MSLQVCPECSQPLPLGAPAGLCPNCLLQLGFDARPVAARAVEGVASSNEQPGSHIGRYRLLEPLGEGGFGTVWLAEQQEPVRRKVALKIIKLGMDTKEVVARFDAERQALALMDHPHIARVFDGGATERGRPYFVMELVRGERITDYCDRRQLSTEARLKLFMSVCQAVQHAHQKGVIHRDLKPSNVLVTEQDGRPVPKVIDFGIAKATEADLTGKTLFTRFNQLIGTPAYMSPEQAGLGNLDIDTRSDIYSLGVLLYELLTGRTPFSNEDLHKAGLDQVLRIIREQEPPKPSTQLSTLSQADLLVVAERRRSEPARLNRLVRGELDWIVMKCLEKDRARRYESANGLARDIERHLNNEPVVAAATGLGYQFRKFAARNRVALATASAFGLLLIAGVLVSTWQAVRANRFAMAEAAARQIAQTNWFNSQRSLYAADMNLAAEAVRINSLGRARDLLERHRARPGEPDFRHWEWSCLQHEISDHAAYSFHLTNSVFNRLGIAPDGKTLAVPCGGQAGVQLWDVATRSVRGELPGRCFQAFFSPGSHFVATVVSQQGRVDVFDAHSGERVASLPRDDNANDVAFSPDESLIAITSDDRKVGSQVNLRLWRWRDQALLGLRSFPSGFESFHYKVAFHPDGKRLAIGERQGGVRLLSTTNLTELQALEVFEPGVTGVAISPDGRWLAGASSGRESVIYVWDLQTSNPPVTLRGHISTAITLAFSPDSRWLASGATDQMVMVWEMPQRRLRATLRGHRSDLRSVGFLGERAMLVSGDFQAEIKFWDLNAAFTDTNDLQLPPMNAPLLTTNFQHFAGLNTNGIAMVGGTYPAPTPREIPELGDKLRLLAMTPSGDHLAAVDSSNTLRILRLADGHLAVRTNPHPVSLVRLGFVREGKFLVAITDEGHVLRWTRELVEVPPPNLPTNSTSMMLPEKFLNYIGFKIQETDFAFCETVNGYRVFDLAEGRLLGSPSPYRGALGGSAISRDGRLFAIGNANGQVQIYDTATWQLLGEPMNCHSDWIQAVAFSPDGRRLATTGTGRESVRLWDMATRQQLCTLPVEAPGAVLLQFSADGRRLAFTTAAKQVRIVTVEMPN